MALEAGGVLKTLGRVRKPKVGTGTSPPWSLCAPSAGVLGSNPGQETRSHMGGASRDSTGLGALEEGLISS